MAILTYSQQQAIKPISANNERRYLQIEKDTEELYLTQLLGTAFAQDVQAHPTNYVALLDGVSFDYCGQTIKQVGLRTILAYFVYAQYIGVSDIEDTFTGVVMQNRAETTHVSAGRIANLQNDNRQIAQQYWEVTKKYLNSNTATYPLWCGQVSKPYSPKITTIRKV